MPFMSDALLLISCKIFIKLFSFSLSLTFSILIVETLARLFTIKWVSPEFKCKWKNFVEF